MFSLFRPKASVVVKKPRKPLPFKIPMDSLLTIRFGAYLFVFSFLVLLFSSIYYNPQVWLEKLDRGPIKGYALLSKVNFTQNADIRDALAQEPPLKGYFAQDVQGVAQKLQTIPWVKDVIVRKNYPNSLSIWLAEHRPFAIWNNYQLLSDQGAVFNLPTERFNPNGLPLLYGPDSQSKTALEAWFKIGSDLQSRHLSLKSLKVDERDAWTVTLDDDIELRLGRGDWVKKIDLFVKIFPQISVPEGKKLAYVDLRYKYGAAVGFRDQ